MDYPVFLLEIFAFLLLYTLLYEMVRYRFKKKMARKFRKSVRDFIHNHQINIERSRLMAKQMIRLDLLEDQQINQAILHHAKEHDMPIESAREMVEEYIDEIVPSFNILSYYKLAYTVSKAILHLAYDVVIDKASLERLESPPGVVQVYVMNHRSNADFVLAGYMLSKNICISFAVGEWARIWPLESIFKSFGSYFVRRGFRVPLYHKVLERYLALITKTGLNQGIFIEGGLSRDGKLRPPKFGLLNYILQAADEEDFPYKDVQFIPTGINFDWVLEDKNLIGEKKRKAKKRNFFIKIISRVLSLSRLIILLPIVAVTNLFKALTRQLKRFGYSSVSFGEPISLKEYYKTNDFSKVEGEDRKKELLKFSEHLLEKIGNVIPITPVSLTCCAFLSLSKKEVSKGELLGKIKELLHQARIKKSPVVMGADFNWYKAKTEALEAEKDTRREELLDIDKELVEGEAAEKTLYLSLQILERRKILGKKKDLIFLYPKKQELVEYYSNSIAHIFS